MPTEEELKAELEKLKAENAALKSRPVRAISMKVSEKGGLSVYGLGRFPVTLYQEQWTKLLDLADDIRTFIRYALTGNSGEIWTIFLAPFLGLPVPLLPIHILWVNLVTDGLPGLALAEEPADRDVMRRPPRPPGESIVAHGLGRHALIVGLLMASLTLGVQAWAIGSDREHWQSMVFTVLVFCQLVHAMAIRSETQSLFSIGLRTNRPLLATVVLSVGLQLALLYVPVLQPVFRTAALSPLELLVVLVVPLAVLAWVEAEKAWLRRHREALSGSGG